MEKVKYVYGVHCGDSDCYACDTQRHNCDELGRLDAISNREEEYETVSNYEGME